jgi:hypothetical protein
VVLSAVVFRIATARLGASAPASLAAAAVAASLLAALLRRDDVAAHYALAAVLLYYIFTEIPGLDPLVSTALLLLIVYVWTEFINPGEHVSETSMCLVYAIVLAKGILFVLNAVLGTGTPIVAVVSNSMKHDSTNLEYAARVRERGFPIADGFVGGDVLLVVGTAPERISVGDVVVYYHPQVPMPIVHRVVGIACSVPGEGPCRQVRSFTTRGDHNSSPDVWAVTPAMLEGRAVLRIPKLGLIKAGPVCMLKSSCSLLDCVLEGECKGTL